VPTAALARIRNPPHEESWAAISSGDRPGKNRSGKRITQKRITERIEKTAAKIPVRRPKK